VWRVRSVAAPEASEAADSFAVFYREQYPPMVRLAYLLTFSAEVAEDVVQDSFMRIHDRYGTLNNPGGYLRTTIVNRSRELARRRRLEQRLLGGLRSDEPIAASAGGELADVVRRLPERQRTVVVLRYWADWSEADIAQALDCRPGTVKSLASRALARLREELR
jgi:RNA polymerase sigma-70 factor (sigma-E family)